MIAVALPAPPVIAPFIRSGDEAGSIWLAGAEDLKAWAMAAAPGDRFIYAKAAMLPRVADVAVLARSLYGDGLINLVQQPQRFGGAHYVAVRSSRRWPHRFSTAQEAEALSKVGASARLMYTELVKVAAGGRPCPLDHEMRKLTGMLPYMINQARCHLINSGLISVENYANKIGGIFRVVTIAATSQRSAAPPKAYSRRVI